MDVSSNSKLESVIRNVVCLFSHKFQNLHLVADAATSQYTTQSFDRQSDRDYIPACCYINRCIKVADADSSLLYVYRQQSSKVTIEFQVCPFQLMVVAVDSPIGLISDVILVLFAYSRRLEYVFDTIYIDA